MNRDINQLLDEVVQHPIVKRGLTTFGHTASVQIFIEDNSVLNACAYEFKNKCCINITTAMLDKLNDDELKAVLAHECSHLIHRDYKSKSIVAFILSLLASALIIVLALRLNLLLLLLSPLSVMLYYYVHYFFFRIAELKADRLAVKVAGKEAMLSLFSKALYHQPKEDILSSALERFSSHPIAIKRIQAVERL